MLLHLVHMVYLGYCRRNFLAADKNGGICSSQGLALLSFHPGWLDQKWVGSLGLVYILQGLLLGLKILSLFVFRAGALSLHL